MKKAFREWLKENNMTLLPWQMEAATRFLLVVEKNQGAASGKTHLLKTLSTFIEVHGNCFTVEES